MHYHVDKATQQFSGMDLYMSRVVGEAVDDVLG